MLVAGIAAPEWLRQLTQLAGAELVGMRRPLASLPESLGQLSQLQWLDLSNCSLLTSLPNSLGRLAQLDVLNLSECSSLTSMPESWAN